MWRSGRATSILPGETVNLAKCPMSECNTPRTFYDSRSPVSSNALEVTNQPVSEATFTSPASPMSRSLLKPSLNAKFHQIAATQRGGCIVWSLRLRKHYLENGSSKIGYKETMSEEFARSENSSHKVRYQLRNITSNSTIPNRSPSMSVTSSRCRESGCARNPQKDTRELYGKNFMRSQN